MPRYTIQFVPSAERSLERFPSVIRSRIDRAIEHLGDEPRPHGIRQVHAYAERTYRIRVGPYRVLYEIHDDEVLVLIVRVAHRKDAYGLREHQAAYSVELSIES